ncbi:MAG: glycosyltransferase family 4 protein [Bradymonadaceae bacterium]|nr:glycosyltransferase family 4 protein [Lujinxingiaceae bacterium]
MRKLVHITTVAESFIFLRGQIAFMKEQGYEIHAISSPSSLLDEFAEREGVKVYPVEMARKITPLKDLQALYKIQSILHQIKPDIVHAHTPKGGLLGMLAATMARAPQRIYHMRGLPMMTAQSRKRRLLSFTEQISCTAAHQVICVGPSLREVAIAERLCAGTKITVLGAGSGNGVDAAGLFNPARLAPDARNARRAELGIGPDALVIGFVGRIVRDKGVFELVEAWKSLREGYPDLHLVVVGPFEAQDPVPAATEAVLRGDEKIHLVGYTKDTASMYATMDLVVLPTYREGFPNVPLEAAAMELPVVATRIPGCVDAVEDGVTGTLVDARDTRALRSAIARYLDEPELRASHGLAGRTRVLRDFIQARIWSDLAKIYGGA